MSRKEDVAEYVKALKDEGFDPEDFFVLDMPSYEDGTFDIPDLMTSVHSLPAQRVKQAIKAASRLWWSIQDVADSYPLDEKSFLPIEQALAETGQPDPLTLFTLFLLARDATHFTDAAKSHQKKEKTAKSGGNARAQKFAPIKKGVIDAWASGKYLTRELCAEHLEETDQEGKYKYSSMIKWLTNTPDPSPWPAKNDTHPKRR